MNKTVLALYSSDSEYTRRFCNFVTSKGIEGFDITAYTAKDKLISHCDNGDIDILLVTEDRFTPEFQNLPNVKTLLLKEDEYAQTDVPGIYKYQTCGQIVKEIMGFCATQKNISPKTAKRSSDLHIIGLYTPVHRSLQTSFSIAIGEVLAKKHKTLYMNFETFSGWQNIMHKQYSTDMSDLMYFINNAPESVYYKLQSMVEKIHYLDYVPPAFSYMDIARITPTQWFELFSEIEKQSSYEYLILDLSDNMQGLFDILRKCEKIITLIRDDKPAKAKMIHYEELLKQSDYVDVSQITCKYKLPLIRDLPSDIEQLTRGELADIARNLFKEELAV